jgi:DNA polymerase I-like protein with 3'-5' exonuclease and polymerase domains
LSEDKRLLQLLNGGDDLFNMLAQDLFPKSELNHSTRQKAKSICYGVIYGMGIHSIAEELNITTKEASDFMISFNRKFPGIQKYQEQVIEKCTEVGYVTTLLGRRRYLPDIHSTSMEKRSKAQRQALSIISGISSY